MGCFPSTSARTFFYHTKQKKTKKIPYFLRYETYIQILPKFRFENCKVRLYFFYVFQIKKFFFYKVLRYIFKTITLPPSHKSACSIIMNSNSFIIECTAKINLTIKNTCLFQMSSLSFKCIYFKKVSLIMYRNFFLKKIKFPTYIFLLSCLGGTLVH